MRHRLNIFACLMRTPVLTLMLALIVAAGCRSHSHGDGAARSSSGKTTVASAILPPATNPSDDVRAVHLSTSAATRPANAPTTQSAQSNSQSPPPEIATVFGDFQHTPIGG